MVLGWFILGIAIIFCIARYNESNRLFWQLLLALLIGFSATKMAMQMSESKDDVALTQVSPTQVSISQTWATIVYNACVKNAKVVTAQPLASQEYTPVLHESKIILSKICGRVRDQPQEVITNPPEIWSVKDFLTLHDYG